MSFSSHLLRGVATAAILYGLYWVYFELTIGARRRKMMKNAGCLPVPRYPCKDPLVGSDLFRDSLKQLKARNFLNTVKGRFERMGTNTFGFRAPTGFIVVTREPENLKTVQALKFKDWQIGEGRKESFAPLLGPGIFTTNGAEWQHSREMLRPNFVRSQVGDLATFETHVTHLINHIPKDGKTPVNLLDLFFRLTIDSATEFLFGESCETLVPGSESTAIEFAGAFNRSQEKIGDLSRWGPLSFIFRWDKQFAKDCKTVHDIVDSYVYKGLAIRQQLLEQKDDDSRRYVFLHELVRQTTDPMRIRSELLNILLAGRDTTASLLSNVWWTLSKRPDIFHKLRAEVMTLEGKPTFEKLKELKYLRALLNESLRLYPVVPANSRQAVVDTVLPRGGGPDGKSPLFVKAGEQMVWNVYAMHRRKDLYGPDAEEFRPERWLGDKGLRPSWEFLPFNGGPRICLGQQFALTEASYTTVRLMQHFCDIKSADDIPHWREWLTLTAVVYECNVVLTPA